jgi:hypothetical protein
MEEEKFVTLKINYFNRQRVLLGVGSRCFPEGDFSVPCRYEMSVKITE